ncbi:HSF5 protein, partial [Urocynchramus pylzowi]|nr:HSF5 protein [Urocynchramus pylzowi]
PAGLSASTFPAKLWRLANDPRVRSVRWDSRAQGLLIDRSLFEQELLSPGRTCQAAPDSFKAMQFHSFVRQLHRYGFHEVLARDGTAEPG